MKNDQWYVIPIYWFLLMVCCLPFTACDDDDDPVTKRTFNVVIQNVSTATTLQPGAMPDRTAPLSPGVWAVLESGSVFATNMQAELKVERLAEEGETTMLTAGFAGDEDVEDHGEFSAPGGPDNSPAIGAGQSVSFSFEASPGDKLQILTMFGQSNDWFYAFGSEGLDLFNGDDPVDGDHTSHLVLYDAGTELDEMPGLGVTQKPDHPTTIDVGPADPVDMITNAISRHSGFVIPATNSVIKISITPEL